jgi:hypothetical protein
MADIRTIIETMLEGPTFMLRQDTYRPGEAQELIADVVALANSAWAGKRYVVFGVESAPGSSERRVVGLSDAPNSHMWQQLVREYVEPEVRIEYRTEALADRKVGVLTVLPCPQPPYLMKRTLGTLERGGGFIRRGTTRDRLVREDLETFYARRFDPAARFAGLRVGFAGEEPLSTVVLGRQDDAALPSHPFTSKLRELIEARGYVDQVASGGDSGIVRMVHLRIFGPDVPYESRSMADLRSEFEQIEASFGEEDRKVRYERDAARINLVVSNESAEALEDAALIVHFPVAAGFEIVAGGGLVASSGRVDGKPESAAVSLARPLGRIEQGARVAVFGEPLRVVITSQCQHRALPVRYELRANNLPSPMQGKLKIEVA